MIEGAFPVAVSIVAEVLFAATGELFISGVTLGRHKPRWDLVRLKGRGAVALSEPSVLVGMAFWLAVAALITILVTGG